MSHLKSPKQIQGILNELERCESIREYISFLEEAANNNCLIRCEVPLDKGESKVMKFLLLNRHAQKTLRELINHHKDELLAIRTNLRLQGIDPDAEPINHEEDIPF